jgi:hypothetical protein
MDPKELKAYLDSLCDQLDAGHASVRAVRWAGAALVASGTLTACFDGPETIPLYGVVMDTGDLEQICDDEIDNDHDGEIDCDDPDCIDDAACVSDELYGAPPA